MIRPPFPATALLVLSHAPAGADRRVVESAAARALGTVAGSEPARVPVHDGCALVVAGTAAPDSAAGDDRVIGLSLGPRTLDGRLLDAGAITERLARGDVGDVAPPFAACALPDGPGAVVAATDSAGLRHVYYVQGPGWAAVSTSSLALAMLAESPFDEEAVGTFALAGNYLGEQTPFQGVGLLPAGASAHLAAGRVRVHRQAQPALTNPPLDRPAAVAAGVGVMRDLAAACLRAYPDPLLELSGGLDSRMLLAGLPTPERARLRAATVGPSGSADHRVAASLARRCGLAHTQVTLDGIATLDPVEIGDLATAAALRRDCGGSPAALAVLDWQERELDQGPRLTGQNGEFARGFYYAGQRAHPRPTDDLVDTLARWRIFTNEAADPALFADGFLEDMRSAALRAVRAAFAAYDTDWLRATDEFYLHERMRRWVGISYSWACTRRVVQAPFFHRPFLEWARRCSPADKRGSKVFAAVLTALDPALAATALAGGRTPRAISSPSSLERLSSTLVTARKVVRKIDQRLRRTSRPANGAAVVAAGVQAAWSRQAAALDALADLPFLDARVVREVAGGRRPATPATVGLLLDLDVARRAVRDQPS